MRVAFRVDAGLAIGAGHVQRCLTLADELSAKGAKACFFTKPHKGHLDNLIVSRGHRHVSLGEIQGPNADPNSYETWVGGSQLTDAELVKSRLETEKFDWLVVDHYGLSIEWENLVRHSVARLLVIDDLLNRTHCSDILVDPSLATNEKKERGLESCKILQGPKFAFLRPEFSLQRAASVLRRRKAELKSVLISMGGIDLDNNTKMVLDVLSAPEIVDSGITFDVVLGAQSPWISDIKELAAKHSCAVRVHLNPPSMSKLMTESDLAIGASGGTAWERCCLGLPTLQIAVVENQIPNAESLALRGAAITIDHENLETDLSFWLRRLRSKPELLFKVSQSAQDICDGLGCERVVGKMMEMNSP